MAHALIALGSNLGDRRQALQQAVALLGQRSDVQVLHVSGWHETLPIGGPAGQPAFLNGALTLETNLGPEALLAELQQIEQSLHRRRDERWAARTLDLDLLLYDDWVIDSPTLTLPHPRMAFRRFVLEAAVEVAADWVHPQIGWTLETLLDHLRNVPPYVAITGAIGAGKSRLATKILARLPGRLIAGPPDPPWLLALSNGPSSLDWQREIELLGECTRLLDASTLMKPPQLVVSDFWFDQLLAYAAVLLPQVLFEAYSERWQAARRQVASPKLIVWLVDEPSDLAAGANELEQAIADHIYLPDQGPVLKLAAGDPADAVTEAVAAIQAMG